MAIHNVTPAYTFEEWRLDYNNLAVDIGDIESGITGSIPASTPTYTTVETALEGIISDINNIMNGTYQFSGSTTTISQDFTVQGDSQFDGDVTINGSLVLGNQDTDSITIAADLASHLIPDLNNTYDIGSSAKSWKDLYLAGDATIGGDVVIDGNITVNGQTTASEGFSIAVAIALG